MAAAKLLTAKVTFETDLAGRAYRVAAGDTLRSTHPVVKGREELFEAAGEHVDHEAKPRRRRKGA